MTLLKQAKKTEISKEIDSILNQELECFQNLLIKTEEASNLGKNISLDNVQNLLKARSYWIELLKDLEQKKENIGIQKFSNHKVREEISQIARTLVAIDAKILDILSMKKLQLIRDFTSLTDNKHLNKDYSLNDSYKSKIIDIIQE